MWILERALDNEVATSTTMEAGESLPRRKSNSSMTAQQALDKYTQSAATAAASLDAKVDESILIGESDDASCGDDWWKTWGNLAVWLDDNDSASNGSSILHKLPSRVLVPFYFCVHRPNTHTCCVGFSTGFDGACPMI